MGTNYYIRYNICNCCKRYDEIHMGKQSMGWKFNFHVIEEQFPINEWENNAKELLKNNIYINVKLDSYKKTKNFLLKYSKYVKIFSEYDREILIEDFLKIVESNQHNLSFYNYCVVHNCLQSEYMDSDNYEFSPNNFS